MAGGGMNSPGKSVVNYVDLDASSGLRDYGCGTVTYDGHQGTDMEILNFYEMDEGVAVLSAAQGVVIYTHDGEYDRETEDSTARQQTLWPYAILTIRKRGTSI